MSLFFNSSPNASTSFSNNNNNPSQPNPNNQTGIFSAPTIPPNNSFGNMPPQLTFGSANGGGGLLGNPQPSGGLFGNQIQQQPQGGGLFGGPQPSGGGLFGNQMQQRPSSSGLFGGQSQQQAQGGGGLFSNQVQQQPQTGGLFGGPRPSGGGLFGNQMQQQPSSGGLFGGGSVRNISSLPSNGTVDLIGRFHIYPKNKDNFGLPSIISLNDFKDFTLDEIRMKDYFNLKNDTLDLAQKNTVRNVINMNLNRIGSPTIQSPFFSTGLPPNLTTLFSDTTLNPQLIGNSTQPAPISGGLFMNPQPSQTIPSSQNAQPTTLFGGNNTQTVPASGGLFMNPQPSQITPPPLVANVPTNKPSGLQSFSLPTQTPTVSQVETKKSLIKYVKPRPAKSEKKALEFNSGSFSYEFNKMLFVSGLVQIMEKHNMTVPENLLDDTDFAPQLLAFLEQHNISLPTQNIPQFQISSVAPLGNESENNFGELNNDEEYNNYC